MAALLLALVALCGASNGVWTVMTAVTHPVNGGGALTYGSFPVSPFKDSIYCMCGDNGYNNGRDFYRYDISSNAWSVLASLPSGAEPSDAAGGALCFTPVDGYERIYALAGAGNPGFFGYFVHGSSSGTWTSASDGLQHNAGCALCYGGGGTEGGLAAAYVYAFKGSNFSGAFSRYYFLTTPYAPQPLTTHWTSKASYGSATGSGAGLAYDTLHNDLSATVYGLRGAGTQDFKGYVVSTNTWGNAGQPSHNVGVGGCIAAKTVGGKNDSVYALLGDGTRKLEVYVVSLNQWKTAPDDLSDPYTPGTGAGLAYCPKNQDFYATMGGGTTDFLQYAPYAFFGGGQGSAGHAARETGLKLTLTGPRAVRIQCPTANRPVIFRAYDASGKLVWKSSSQAGTVDWLVGREIPAGVYCVTALSASARSAGNVVIPK